MTLDELAASCGLVEKLLSETDDLSGLSVEELARALAIRHLCFDQALVYEQMKAGALRMSGLGGAKDLDDAQRLFERYALTKDVFGTAIAMLGKQSEEPYLSGLREYMMHLNILREQLTSRVMSKGVSAPFAAPPRLRFQRIL